MKSFKAKDVFKNYKAERHLEMSESLMTLDDYKEVRKLAMEYKEELRKYRKFFKEMKAQNIDTDKEIDPTRLKAKLEHIYRVEGCSLRLREEAEKAIDFLKKNYDGRDASNEKRSLWNTAIGIIKACNEMDAEKRRRNLLRRPHCCNCCCNYCR